MTGGANDLIQGYLDGALTPEQEAELNGWVKRDLANARVFAAAMLLHDRLRNEICALPQISSTAIGQPEEPVIPHQERARRRWRPMAALASLAAVFAMLFFLGWSRPAPLNAATELSRLINTSATQTDRTYRIRSLDETPDTGDERRPPIDGATLYVRSPEKYVLVRRFPNGEQFVTGSDGVRSWAIRPAGAVRVSKDPLRFRGPVPGHQHGLPFVDLRSDLVQLRDAYIVTLLGTDDKGRRGLLAEKKSPRYRGPRQVELWYDARTGVIDRMVFRGMPRARGGPSSVSVELLDQRSLGADYFQHDRHHAPGRRVIEED